MSEGDVNVASCIYTRYREMDVNSVDAPLRNRDQEVPSYITCREREREEKRERYRHI